MWICVFSVRNNNQVYVEIQIQWSLSGRHLQVASKRISPPCLCIGRTYIAPVYCAISEKQSVKQFAAMLPGSWPLKLCHLLTCLMCWILFQLDPVSKHISALKKHPSLCGVLCWLSIFFTRVKLQWKVSQIACLMKKLLLDYFCWGGG